MADEGREACPQQAGRVSGRQHSRGERPLRNGETSGAMRGRKDIGNTSCGAGCWLSGSKHLLCKFKDMSSNPRTNTKNGAIS